MGNRNWFLVVGVIGLTFFGIPLKRKIQIPEYESLFNDYITKFNKTYKKNETEYFMRMENFKESLKLIEELNKNRTQNLSAMYGLTEYADMSQDEFKKMKLTNHSMSSFKIFGKHNSRNKVTKNKTKEFRLKRALNKLPSMIDWRNLSVVGPVHNQKTCGACWAFSAIETIESMYALKRKTFLSLSVQEAIDCAGDGNYGCEGGDSCSLLHWLVTTKTKITTEKAYPFTYQTQTCKLKAPKIGVQVESYTCDDFRDREDLLLQNLANHGPVAAAVNALNWQYYLGGIIQFHCSGALQDMNHSVQIVGYDKTGPVPYYILRNSWGTDFGDNGYLYIAIGSNVCGIANTVTSVAVL